MANKTKYTIHTHKIFIFKYKKLTSWYIYNLYISTQIGTLIFLSIWHYINPVNLFVYITITYRSISQPFGIICVSMCCMSTLYLRFAMHISMSSEQTEPHWPSSCRSASNQWEGWSVRAARRMPPNRRDCVCVNAPAAVQALCQSRRCWSTERGHCTRGTLVGQCMSQWFSRKIFAITPQLMTGSCNGLHRNRTDWFR